MKEVEPNNTIAAAQSIATLPASVAGALSTTTDTDYFKTTIAAGRTLTAALSAGASSAFGLAIYTSAGQQLLLMHGVAGVKQQVQISNAGSASVQVVVRVLRSSGSTGAYTLTMN